MIRFRLLLLPALAGCVAASLAATAPAAPGTAPAPAPAAARSRPLHYIDGIADTGQFLPDSAVILRVDERVIRVGEFIESYFNSYAVDRPGSDSTGRVEFIQAMINKEVLGRTARAAGYSFRFEERAKMRAHSDQILSNVLFQRAIADSSQPTEEQVRQTYHQYRDQLLFRHIQFADRATAERVRLDLMRGRISWLDAVKKYTTAAHDAGPDGLLGWKVRMGTSPTFAWRMFSLKPNEISEVFEDTDGLQLVQCVERRPASPPAFESLRNSIVQELAQRNTQARAARLQDMVSAQIGLECDTAAVRWASGYFVSPRETVEDASGASMVFNTSLPEFSPSDTSRVLARLPGRTYSIGAFLTEYSEIQPLVRPPVHTADAMLQQVKNFILEPYMAKVAIERGLDKDSLAVARIEAKREQLLVERMYEDSVMSRVLVTQAERRKHYKAHLAAYYTFASVRYASFELPSRPAADSLTARLKSGERAEDILRADSLAGNLHGAIYARRQDDVGPNHKQLFEELRPGQSTVNGPDQHGHFQLLQVVSHDPGRQLSFEEADVYVQESLQNIRAEELLKALIGRNKKAHRIEAHPELVMRIRLVDPTL